MLKQLESLIVDQDVQARTRLREVLRFIAQRSDVENARGTGEALTMLQSNKRFDCLFVASSLGVEEVTAFVKKLVSLPQTSKMAIFLILRPTDVGGSLIASLFLNGVHGFVCPPFSADSILELINTTKQSLAYQQEDSKKVYSTASFLIDDMILKLDKLAELKAAGQKGGGYVGKELVALSKSLQDVAVKLGKDFENLLVEKFIALKAPVEKPGRAKAKRVEKPLHPGVVITQLMKKRKLDKERIIAKLKSPPEEFEAVLQTTGKVTKEIADDLARMLGETPSYWMGLQRKFDQYKP
jgi:plasmid maintenance system antidote protein VapI/response regulator RpfG family c-di-GMP phosphodiesterase